MKKKQYFSLYTSLEKRLWGDSVNANPVLATLTIIMAALLGVFYAGGSALNSMLDLDIEVSLAAVLGSFVMMWGYDLAESIMACDKALTALWRSLLLLGLMLAAFVIGAVASIVVIAIVTIVVLFYILKVILSVAFSSGSSSSGKKQWKTDDGETITERSGLLGDKHYRDTAGRDWERDGNSDNFREK